MALRSHPQLPGKPLGDLEISEDILGCHTVFGSLLLAASGVEPEALLSILLYTGESSPHTLNKLKHPKNQLHQG